VQYGQGKAAKSNLQLALPLAHPSATTTTISHA